MLILATEIVFGNYIKSYEQIEEFEILKFLGRFPKRKSALKNDCHKRPLREAKIENSFQ